MRKVQKEKVQSNNKEIVYKINIIVFKRTYFLFILITLCVQFGNIFISRLKVILFIIIVGENWSSAKNIFL